MIDIIIYAALMISAIAGILVGWYSAYALADPQKKHQLKRNGKAIDKPAKAPNARYTTESKSKNSEDEGTISLKDKINGRKGLSLTSFECSFDETDELDTIQEHQRESNSAYNYLKKLD